MLKRIILIIALCSIIITAWAQTFTKVVVFGDSLSDNGNLYAYMRHILPPSPPYYNGRFTNGLVWAEQLLAKYNLQYPKFSLLNYAFGGASVLTPDADDTELFTLNQEVNSYLLAHQDHADPDHLFILWIGANDYLDLPRDHTAEIPSVVNGIMANAERLISKGASNIIILNLPALGKAPVASMLHASRLLNHDTITHNLLLKQKVDTMMQTYPHVKWIYVDVNQWMQDAIIDPEQFGLTNTKDACLTDWFNPAATHTIMGMISILPSLTVHNSSPCTGYLFFDPLHPSAQAHQLLAQFLYDKLLSEGVEII